jgi:adenylosuccinate lyase
MLAELDAEWEVLAEPIQTIMRRYGLPEPYERLKALTRGQAVSAEEVRSFVSSLGLPPDAEAALLRLTPAGYVGLAPRLVEVGHVNVAPGESNIAPGEDDARR